jgi:hypothetical protein
LRLGSWAWLILRLGSRAGLRLNRTGLRLAGSDLGLNGSCLGLCWPGLRLAGANLGLNGSCFRLAGSNGLYLRAVVWFGWPGAGLNGASFRLTRTGFGLAGAGSWVRCVYGHGARDAGLRGDGAGSRDDCGAALVDAVELLAVVCGFALDLNLCGHGRSAWAAHGCDLGGLRPYVDAASAAVVGDACVVIDDDGAIVDVGDVDVDAVDGAVVVEVIALPIAAVVADAGVAEAVVDATVEADVRSPEAAVEAPAVAIPTPVAGGPESAVVRRSAPGAGDPVVAGRAPIPVAGGPKIIWRGSDGLVVDGEGRGRLVSVFDGRRLALFIEFFCGLGVLIGLILIGRGRSGLLGRVLLRTGLLRVLGGVGLGALLGLGLVGGPENPSLRSRGSGLLGLGVVDWRQVNIGGVRAGVVGSGGGVRGIGVAVATCCSDEGQDTE